MTGEIILESKLNHLIAEEVGTEPHRVAAIIDESISAERDEEVLFFRRLLSGVLDPDKLDYLNRDAFFCGVPYGFQDTDFIFDQIVPHKTLGMVMKENGLPGVENVLFSKYLMYRSVYWHKTVRIATAMIKKAIILGMKSGSLEPADLYGIDDEQFTSFMSAKKEPYFRLAADVPDRVFFKCVAEIPFREDDPLHTRLTDLDQRLQREREIAGILSEALNRTFSEEEIILDIPEPISFEINLSILVQGTIAGRTIVPFHQAPSVFNPPVVSGFKNILRKIRLIVPQKLAETAFPFSELLL